MTYNLLLSDVVLDFIVVIVILKPFFSVGSSADALMAYQIAFDLYESATQQFLSRVLATIKKTAPALPAVPAAEPEAAAETAAAEGESADKMETDDKAEGSAAAASKAEASKPVLSKEEAELNDKVIFSFIHPFTIS